MPGITLHIDQIGLPLSINLCNINVYFKKPTMRRLVQRKCFLAFKESMDSVLRNISNIELLGVRQNLLNKT